MSDVQAITPRWGCVRSDHVAKPSVWSVRSEVLSKRQVPIPMELDTTQSDPEPTTINTGDDPTRCPKCGRFGYVMLYSTERQRVEHCCTEGHRW